jgi:hypothetical protein
MIGHNRNRKHTRHWGTQHARARAWRNRHRAAGLKCHGYLDPRGHWDLEDKTLELYNYKKTELEELKYCVVYRRSHKQ